MPNMFDYLTWRGDLSFTAAPFSEVDNMILSELSYIDYFGILPEDFFECMTLRDAEACLADYREADQVEMGAILPKDILPLFHKAAQSRRFGEILLSGFETRIDTESEVQFAAVTMRLGDGTVFVSYRGTDDNIVGWKEDFNMTFMPVVPSQSYAVQYLDRMAAIYPDRIRVGGHSKGGNLSVYAAACASAETQKRIIEVYCNDGPGFTREFLDSPGYRRILPLVRNIVPQSSVVGRLLEHEGECTVVKSIQNGIFQHDAFSWEVEGTEFVRAEGRTEESVRVEKMLKGWIEMLDDSQREEFVETVYQILTSPGKDTFADLNASKDSGLRLLAGITREQRAVLHKTLRDLWSAGQRVLREEREEKKEERRLLKKTEEVEKRRRKRAELRARAARRRRGEVFSAKVGAVHLRIVRAPNKRHLEGADQKASASGVNNKRITSGWRRGSGPRLGYNGSGAGRSRNP